eukprot:gnl/Dysnectes_brevis/1948_a2239_1652.p1 GENE.gnl/Dysnectes_brevis/1948_a2239_1652~~gnl/Dysnectes_brevis/1948_a2239_1652.p1  ORF type:complete len:225 (+),score=72.71 gnl/Dysnectes_brevis/1948_a2239_1652:684-1358(+)
MQGSSQSFVLPVVYIKTLPDGTEEFKKIAFLPHSTFSTAQQSIIIDAIKKQAETKASSASPKPARKRNRSVGKFSIQQTDTLLKAFSDNPRPTASAIEAIAAQVSLTAHQVKIWFQNKRARRKKKTTSGKAHGESSTSHSTSRTPEPRDLVDTSETDLPIAVIRKRWTEVDSKSECMSISDAPGMSCTEATIAEEGVPAPATAPMKGEEEMAVAVLSSLPWRSD